MLSGVPESLSSPALRCRAGALSAGLRSLSLALLLGVLFVLCPVSPASAQGTYDAPGDPVGPIRTNLGGCLTRFDGTLPPADLRAPTRPQGVTTLDQPKEFVENAMVCAQAFGGDVMLDLYGRWLFYPLAIIMVVWTGVTISFSGRFDLAEIISMIMLLGFVWMLLGSYGSTSFQGEAVWGDIPFPRLMYEFADFIVEGLVNSTFDQIANAWTSSIQILRVEAVNKETMEAHCQSVDQQMIHSLGNAEPGMVAQCRTYRGAQNAKVGFLLIFAVYLAMVLILGAIPLLVAYFSYLWGAFSLIVATIVGPILIPFGLVQQTSFLMWGWIRACVGGAVQMLGAVVFTISGNLIVAPLQRYTAQLADMLGDAGAHTPGMVMSAGFGMLAEFLPLLLIAALGAFKAGELTNMLLSGGAPPSSGLGQRYQGAKDAGRAARGVAGGARALGGAVTGAAVGVATGGAAAAGAIGRRALSAATRTRGGGS